MNQLLFETPLGELFDIVRRKPQSSNVHIVTNAPSSSASSGFESVSNTAQNAGKEAVDVQAVEVVDNLHSPKLWPMWKKLMVTFIIAVYTFVFYAGSSIYIVSVFSVMIEYHVTEQVALLGLSLYVLSYGLGPLLWAPLTEVSWIGRNPVYALTAVAFLILSFASAITITQSYSAFLVLRFLQGFFGSPCLANGGASMHDIFDDFQLPFALGVWVAFAYAGPALGPALASYAIVDSGFQITMWQIAYLAVPVCILLWCLPETFTPKIMHRQQYRLRKHADCERQQADNFTNHSVTPKSHESVLATLKDSLMKPIQITLLDPSITFVNLYTSFCYATYYTFFDGLPLAYITLYGFNISQTGLTFISIMAGCAIAALVYFLYIYFVVNPAVRHGKVDQEDRLKPALIAVWTLPIGILIFGWTSNGHIHWAVGMIGIALYSGGVFIILQCICMYLLQSYPDYAASLFAANDACRSILAAGAVHFGIPLYIDLGIGKGCSVLAGVSCLGIIGMFVLYWQGAALRAKSKFAVSR